MPRHHLLLNGPLWSKCQTGKLLKKKCSHLLSWHFPQRPIPPVPPFPWIPHGRSLNKGPCSTLIKHTLYCTHLRTRTVCVCVCECRSVCTYILTHLNPSLWAWDESPHWNFCHVYFSPALKCHVDWHLIGSGGWGVWRAAHRCPNLFNPPTPDPAPQQQRSLGKPDTVWLGAQLERKRCLS